MLILSRREGEAIKVGDDIEIVLVQIKGKIVRLGIQAPPHIAVVRDDAIKVEPRIRQGRVH